MKPAWLKQEVAEIRRLLDSPSSAEQARTMYPQALEHATATFRQIDSAHEPRAGLDVQLLLMETLRRASELGDLAVKEAMLGHAAAHGLSALHLAQVLGEADDLARTHEALCLIASERFWPDRDEALLDAIAHAERAASLWRGIDGAREYALPRVLLQKANCALKVLHNRGASFASALEAYREAAACIGPSTPRRLAELLKHNLAFAQARYDAGVGDLPEKERVERFSMRIQHALNKGDHDLARNAGWGFVVWSWSLEPAPNRHTGEAHQMLARLAQARGDAEDEHAQQYQAVAVFSFLARRKGLPQEVLGAAQARLRDIFARQGDGQAEQDGNLELASQGLEQAYALCKQAENLLHQEPRTAVETLYQAQRHFPTLPILSFYDGVAKTLAGDFAGALQAYNRHLIFMPRNDRALFNRVYVKLKLGDVAGATEDLKAVQELTPNDPSLPALAAAVAAAAGPSAA